MEALRFQMRTITSSVKGQQVQINQKIIVKQLDSQRHQGIAPTFAKSLPMSTVSTVAQYTCRIRLCWLLSYQILHKNSHITCQSYHITAQLTSPMTTQTLFVLNCSLTDYW